MNDTVIFGGTFDPPHKKHFWILESLVNTKWIHKVVVVPAKQNPDKSWLPLFEFDVRLRMLEETIKEFGKHNENFNKLIFDSYFKNKKEPSYIVDYLKNNFDSEVSDVWVYIPTNYHEWSNSKDILNTADNFISVVHKYDILTPSAFLDITCSKTKRFLLIKPESPIVNINSTQIRNEIRNGSVSKMGEGILANFVLEYCKKAYKKST